MKRMIDYERLFEEPTNIEKLLKLDVVDGSDISLSQGYTTYFKTPYKPKEVRKLILLNKINGITYGHGAYLNITFLDKFNTDTSSINQPYLIASLSYINYEFPSDVIMFNSYYACDIYGYIDENRITHCIIGVNEL